MASKKPFGQKPLFESSEAQVDAGMKPSQSTALVISGQILAPEQKLFNQLLEKIEQSKLDIALLKKQMDDFRAQDAKKLDPLRQQQQVAMATLITYLDGRLQGKGLSKSLREDIVDIIYEVIVDLLHGPVQEPMRAIYDRLFPDDMDGEGEGGDGFGGDAPDGGQFNEAELQELRQRLAEDFGVTDTEGLDLNSPQALFEAVMRQQMEQQQARQAAKDAKRKKSKKQQAAEQEDLDAGKALRDIYRKLASALHPDREPDEAERARKHALMVQVNAANDKKDLMALLQLQLQVEQLNPQGMGNMAADKLRHFNRVLKEQANSLAGELRSLNQEFRYRCNLPPMGKITDSLLAQSLRNNSKRLETSIAQIRYETALIADDKALKKWVKTQLSAMDDFPPFMFN